MSQMIQLLSHSECELRLLRRVRLLFLLDGAAEAGLEPVAISVLHALAYLSNALAPVWHLQPFDGKVLKRLGNPFYPMLQMEVDRMVGQGLVRVSEIQYVDVDGKWQLDANYTLNSVFADRVLESARNVRFEPGLRKFCAELAQAMAALPPEIIATVLGQDATYGNPNVDVSNVVNFEGDRAVNFSANSAEAFRPDLSLTAGERVHLYVQHLQHRSQRNVG